MRPQLFVICLLTWLAPVAVFAQGTTAWVRDSFNAPNGTLLRNHVPEVNAAGDRWSISGGEDLVIDAQAVRPTGPGVVMQAIINSTAADAVVSMDWTPLGSESPYGPYAQMILRASDQSNYLLLIYYSGSLILYRWAEAGVVFLGSAPVGAAGTAVHRIQAKLKGSAIEVWWDGIRKFDATDAFNQTATRHGMRWVNNYDYTSRYDNFEVQRDLLSTISRVAVTSETSSVAIGGHVALSARAFDAANNEITNVPFVWTLSNSAAGRLVTGGGAAATVWNISSGQTVTATVPNGVSGSATLTADASRTVIFDSFTGPNELAVSARPADINLVGSSWTTTDPQPAAVLRGNRLQPLSAFGTTNNAADIDAQISDGVIGVDWTATATGTNTGYPLGSIMFRGRDAFNYLAAGYNLGGGYPFSVWKVIDGSWILIATANIAPPQGATHRLEVSLRGPSIEVWSDGVRYLQVADTYNLTATRHGVRWLSVYDAISTYDNFTINAVPGPTIAHVVLTPPAASVPIGNPQTVTATAYDAANNPVAGALFHWTVSDAAAGRLATGGFFAPSATVFGVNGPLQVTATAVGGVAATAAITADNSNTLVFDRFSGANGQSIVTHAADVNLLGSSWTGTDPAPSAILSGNQLKPARADQTTFNNSVAIDSDAPDAVIAVDWTAAASATATGYPLGGVMFRMRDVNNFLVAGYGLGGGYPFSLWKVVNGSYFLLASTNVPKPDGATHRLEVRLQGRTIEVWADDVRRLQVTESFNVTESRHGLKWVSAYDAVSSFDNFTVRGTRRCATLNASSLQMGAAARGNSVAVTAPGTCQWDAYALDDWLHVTTTPTGSGSASVNFLVAANMGATRTGAMVVGGRLFTVTQGQCVGGLSQGRMQFTADGGESSFGVVTLDDCHWIVNSTARSWLVPIDAGGLSSGSARYRVLPNPTSAARTASIGAGQGSFDVTQAAGPSSLASTTAENPADPPDRTVMFLHGLGSSPATWLATASRLQNDLRIRSVLATLPWRERYETQAATLQNNGGSTLPDDTIAVGHSNGGVVAREWSKYKPLGGIITMGTPHEGALATQRLGDAVYFNQLLFDALGLMQGYEQTDNEFRWIFAAMSAARGWVSFFTFRTIAGLLSTFALAEAAPVLGEMMPTSTYLGELNSSANLGRELVTVPRRLGLVFVSRDFQRAPIAAAFFPDDADRYVLWRNTAIAALEYFGAYMHYHYAPWQTAAQSTANWLLRTAGYVRQLDPKWCWTITDDPTCSSSHDGIVDTRAQHYPGTVSLGFIGPAHIEETNQSAILSGALRQVFEIAERGATAVPPLPPPGSGGGPGTLIAGQRLYPDQELSSANNAFTLRYQSDGNLVLYDSEGQGRWRSDTAGTHAGWVELQGDGNFVIYDGTAAVWSSKTGGHPGAFLRLHDEGQLVVHDGTSGVGLWWGGIGGSLQ